MEKNFSLANAKQKYWSYKKEAKKAGRSFKLTFGEFYELCLRSCFYCGRKKTGSYTHNKGQIRYIHPFRSNGIDRISSKGGYTKGNVCTACWVCNNMKGSLTLGDFKKHIARIYRHLSL